jgi:Asp-tRNA(Asn)/Glu-tRNA(Gln) amidotransferase A subunit family amidase
MKTAEQTIFVWEKTTEEQIIEKIKKAIQDFRSIGLEIEEISLKFQDNEDGNKKTMTEEQVK